MSPLLGRAPFSLETQTQVSSPREARRGWLQPPRARGHPLPVLARLSQYWEIFNRRNGRCKEAYLGLVKGPGCSLCLSSLLGVVIFSKSPVLDLKILLEFRLVFSVFYPFPIHSCLVYYLYKYHHYTSITTNHIHSTNQANRTKVYWRQGPTKAIGNQGCTKVRPCHGRCQEASPVQTWNRCSSRDPTIPKVYRVVDPKASFPATCSRDRPGFQD